MKLAELLYGLIIFSLVIALLFSMAGDFFKQGHVDDDGVFTGLSVDYASVSTNEIVDGSTIREIEDATQIGTAASESQDIFLLTGAIQGGRLVVNSIKNFDNIVNNISSTITEGDTAAPPWIDERITNTLKALVVVLIVIVSLQFLRGFKLET